MKRALALLVLSLVSTLAQLQTNFGLSGYVGDELYNTYGGPSSMAFDASGTLWALYSNQNATPPAILQSYQVALPRSPPTFPINEPGTVPNFGFPKGASWTVPVDVTNQTTVLRGLTFNAANNFVLLGERPDPEEPFGVVDYWDTTCDGALWVLNDQAEWILGPMEAVFPLTCQINGITYVASSDSYFITDPSCGMLSDSIITCCREIEPPHPPQNRWLQQILLRRGVGLQYGLLGDLNIFTRQSTAGYSTVAAPGLGSPQDVTYDPQTGNLWVVNNFPTTTVLELTTDYVVVNHYNLESITGGLKDAKAVAVNNEFLFVGFQTEGYIAVFEKPSSVRNNGKDLVLARFRTFEEQKALEAKAKLEAAQLATQKTAAKSVPQSKAPEKKKNEKGHKSHFH